MRARTTKQLAIQIRQLPVTPAKLILANGLANLSTEGDFGHDTLQEVATTLAGALRERPVPQDKGQPAAPYVELAELVRYEHVQASLDDPQFAAATSKLEADDASPTARRFHADGFAGQSVELEGTARQSGAGEFLGHVVPALPQGNSRPRNSLQSIQRARAW